MKNVSWSMISKKLRKLHFIFTYIDYYCYGVHIKWSRVHFDPGWAPGIDLRTEPFLVPRWRPGQMASTSSSKGNKAAGRMILQAFGISFFARLPPFFSVYKLVAVHTNLKDNANICI